MKLKSIVGSCMLIVGLLILNGCSSKNIEEAAFQAYETAFAKGKEMQSADFDINILFDTENWKDGDVRGKLGLTGSFQMKDELPLMLADLNLSVNGIKFTDMFHFYITDNMMYIDIMGKKTKELYQIDEGSSTNNQALDLSPEKMKEFMEECTLEEVDGKQVLHITMNDDFLGNIIELSKDSLKDTYTDEDFAKLKKCMDPIKVDFILDEEHGFHAYSVQVHFENEGEIMDIQIDIALDHINEVESIPFPDFSEFIEKDSFVDELEDFAGGGKLPSGSQYNDFGGEDF